MRPAAPAERTSEPDRPAFEAEEERRVVLERLADELGEDLDHREAGDVLGQVEPVRAEVADDVRRSRCGRVEPPAAGRDEHVVAGVAPVHGSHGTDPAGRHVGAHALDERVAADVVARRGDAGGARGRIDHRVGLRRGDGERLLADDVEPPLEGGERLHRVRGVRRADVEDVQLLGVEQRLEVVVRRRADLRRERLGGRAPADRDDGHAELAQRKRVHACDVPRADDRRARHACEARNIAVSTSMSSLACSGGVRHSASPATHAWKWSSSRENASS